MRGERIRYGLFRRLLPRADLVIAVSNATATDASHLRVVSPQRIRLIREAADPVFSPKPGASGRGKVKWRIDGRYLRFVGALDGRKDRRCLLDGSRAARRTCSESGLLIAC